MDKELGASALLDIIRGVKRSKPIEATPGSRPETAASEIPVDVEDGAEAQKARRRR